MTDFYSNPSGEITSHHMLYKREGLCKGNVQEKAIVQKARQLHAEEREESALNDKATKDYCSSRGTLRQHPAAYTPTRSALGACGNLGTTGSSYLETDSSGRESSIWQEKYFTRFIILYGRKHLLFHTITFKEFHKCPSGSYRGTIIQKTELEEKAQHIHQPNAMKRGS